MIELINTLIKDAFYISYVKFNFINKIHMDICFINKESYFSLLSYNFRYLSYGLKYKIEYV